MNKLTVIWTLPQKLTSRFFLVKRLDDGTFEYAAKDGCYAQCCVCNNPEATITKVFDGYVFIYCSPQCMHYFGAPPSAKEYLKILPHTGRLIAYRLLGKMWSFKRK